MTPIQSRGSVMRLVILVVAGVAIGALSGRAVVQTFGAADAIGGNRSQLSDFKLSDFKLSDLNPVKLYQDMMRKVTSGDYASSLNLPSSPAFKIGPIGNLGWNPSGFKIDDSWKRSFASGLNAQARQSYYRSQDMINYGRNPMGWHGPPPH
jgi:hypothetical protein